MNLEERIQSAVMQKLNDGTVEQIVKGSVESAIKKSLEDAFSWSGAGKKMIDEKVKEVIIPVIERHDFNRYIVKLDSILTEIINQTSLADNKEILENFKALMVEPGEKVIKLSTIFQKYCEYVAHDIDTTELEACCEDSEPYYEHVTAEMEVEHEDRWLAPSVEQKIQCHLKVVEDLHKILPITNIVVELANFDIQKILNPNIEGEEYQKGAQSGFWNVREFVICRDNHTCRHCKGKSNDSVLEVHHIESRKKGGNAPNNLVTLCKTCHQKHHREGMQLNIHRGNSMRHEAFMGVMRREFYNRLKDIYQDVKITYGYITKSNRIANGLQKTHHIDAFCIAGNLEAELLGYYYYQKKVRCHNRQIHKANYLKGGRKKLNQSPYIVLGFRLFDKVKLENEECFVFGRRVRGYFKVCKLDGTVIHTDINYKKLKFVNTRKRYLTERREMEEK